ncbi:Imm1 family immunity protein [Actinopolyspora sp. H202]|uniref:Imm1 family immunity protein n=1 Tax=Actinopolyspora sp. H202 TaxID=1500456 RepID=UPI003EE705B6
MIISASHQHDWLHGYDADQVDQVINTVLTQGSPLQPSEVFVGERTVTLETMDLPEYHVRVCVNPTAGYAALLFTASDLDPDRMWVSFNSKPPLEDPRLASDVDTERYHDRFTAIPIEQARTALREFWSTGGQRPASVTWVAGDYYGRITERMTVAA